MITHSGPAKEVAESDEVQKAYLGSAEEEGETADSAAAGAAPGAAHA